MPEGSLNTFDLDGKTPAELETRRREIISVLTTQYKGYEDPTIPTILLQELAIVTGTLRRKNAGPPKKVKAEPTGGTAKGKKASIDDVLGMV